MSEHGHHAHHDPERDVHGNPHDFETYLARLDDPERDAWQRPDDVVAAMGLRPGGVACDVGAVSGYFALRLARAVSPGGRVHALDVDPRMTAILAERARDAGLAAAVVPHLAEDGEGLPPEPCDAILVVNAYHHFHDGPGRLRRLADRLRPGGRLVIVDFHGRETPVGPPPEHRVSREDFLAAAAAAGLSPVREETFLPYQYLVGLGR